MAKLRIKFQGIFEVDSSEEIHLKPGEKYKISGVLEGNKEVESALEIKEVEIETNANTSIPVAAATVIVASGDKGTPDSLEEKITPFNSPFVTLEQFGGDGYYKLIKKGLRFQGDIIESDTAIFTGQDVGKTFCGLLAHQNPLQPDGNEFFPGIIGSRYALITEVQSPNRIKVNFKFNGQSDMGYIFHDNTQAYAAALNAAKLSQHKTLELQNGKTYVVPEYTHLMISNDLYIFSKKGANLKIGLEDFFPWSDKSTKKQDGHLFEFGGNSVKVGLYNVNFIPPHRRVRAAQLFFTSLFKSSPNKDQQSNVAVLNMDTTIEVDFSDSRFNQIGFGYGFFYSSEPGNYVIGKNIKHRGPGFMDFKANYGGGLYAVFENIQTDFKNEEDFASPRIKVKGNLKDNIFTITSGHTIYQIYTYNFGRDNVSHILHFQGYTFIIDGKEAVINATQFRVRPFVNGKHRLLVRDAQSVYAKDVELHAGDRLTYDGMTYLIVEKTRTYVTEWSEGGPDKQFAMVLKLDKPMPLNVGFYEFEVNSIGESLNNGQERDAYLIFKANYEFRTYSTTKFEDPEVLSTDPIGHLSYNHKEITLWAKNFKHNGFYRQSLSEKGNSFGYTMIDCEGFGGQFKPDVEIKHAGEMPAQAADFIAELERKFG